MKFCFEQLLSFLDSGLELDSTATPRLREPGLSDTTGDELVCDSIDSIHTWREGIYYLLEVFNVDRILDIHDGRRPSDVLQPCVDSAEIAQRA